MQKSVIAIAAVALAVFGCASADTVNPTTVDGLEGYTLRVIHPGEMLPMIYQSGRVNITVDKDNKITAVSFF
ncbi:MAG TPA: I78 family peptidase inhibitor [Rhizomicrobium sp.]|nr:I78 family peptidase inhibitor [Rhizomicrobium sp.]